MHKSAKQLLREVQYLRAKISKDWIQDAIKKPGRLHKYFGIPEEENIPESKINSEISKLRKKETRSKEETSLLRALNLAKTLKKMANTIEEYEGFQSPDFSGPRPVPSMGIKTFPQNKWVTVGWQELSEQAKTDVWDVYDLAYGKIGKHVPNIEKFASKYKFFYLIDVDDDIKPDAFIAYKKTKAGYKIALLATDGGRKAKKAVILKLKDLAKRKGWWMEASHAVAKIVESAGLKPIDDEQVVRAALGPKKEIIWLGDGKYERSLGSLGGVVKSLYGDPRV